jgi:4-methyl-5(b-hydroxyethyl)-thiazole monophosphate biosynthesis
MEKQVLVPVADGTEELEAIAVIDVLRRAAASVTVASVVSDLTITSSHNVRLVADCLIEECVAKAWDLVALPGGIPGAEHLRDSAALTAILEAQVRSGGLYAAICASPSLVLAHHGHLENRKATCHPGFTAPLGEREGVGLRVVVDGECITARGAGVAVEFALTLVEKLYGSRKRQEVAESLAL